MSRWVVYELVGGLWLDGWFMSGWVVYEWVGGL